MNCGNSKPGWVYLEFARSSFFFFFFSSRRRHTRLQGDWSSDRVLFRSDQVEKFDLEVLGVMPNFLGPKQSIILVQLKGQEVERTGVVAGMSGSPVYLDGKLAGALSLKLGTFTKDPIAGVTPIADVIAGGSFNSPAMTTSIWQRPS